MTDFLLRVVFVLVIIMEATLLFVGWKRQSVTSWNKLLARSDHPIRFWLGMSSRFAALTIASYVLLALSK